MSLRAITLLSVLWFLLGPTSASPQAVELAARQPRFIAASQGDAGPTDIGVNAILHRRITLALTNVSADEAVMAIVRNAELQISYNPGLLRSTRNMSVHASDVTVAAALTEVLTGTGMDVVISPGGQMALVHQASQATRTPQVDSAAIVGRVTDKSTAVPLANVTVVLDATNLSAVSNADGRYRLPGVSPGSYSLRARLIGYSPAVVPVTITGRGETEVNLELTRSVQQLDDVVTTGTVLPTAIKALPTPVTVINAQDIGRQRAYDLGEVVRQSIPTATSRRNVVSSPTTTFFATRGATSLSSLGGRMKVFVDGIESADRVNGGVDPSTIERVEILRGPQAAAIYGSDAIGGVIQIFTKRGTPGLGRPRYGVEGSWGLIQSPTLGYETALRQTYRASAEGGMADATYHFSASYEHNGAHAPEGQHSSGGVAGGIRLSRGMMDLDFSGRYFIYTTPTLFNPVLTQSGFSDFAAPYYQTFQEQDQAVGVRLRLRPRSWWQHSATVGVDRRSSDMAQARPRHTFPEDTLLSVYNADQTRTSLAYNTSVQGSLVPGVSAVLTLGADYYRLPTTNVSNFGGLLTTEGTLTPVPDNPLFASRGTTTNSGFFAQTQVNLREALFLTAGLRLERNSNFGDSLSAPLSPRVGMAYVRQTGPVTVKLRGGWGRAIRPPNFGAKVGSQSALSVRLDNPGLGPERQQGWDAGIDAVIGDRASVGVTYFDQRASNLIDVVTLATTPRRITQSQNVGEVRNTGVELEGSLELAPFRFGAQYGYTRSRVERLAAGYRGDQRVGAQVIGLPEHTAGASLSLDIRPGMTLSTGVSYVGSRQYYDWIAFYRCLGGTGSCRNDDFALRDYLTTYSAVFRMNAAVSQRVGRFVSAFVRIENLTNNESSDLANDADVIGRVTTVGLRFANE